MNVAQGDVVKGGIGECAGEKNGVAPNYCGLLRAGQGGVGSGEMARENGGDIGIDLCDQTINQEGSQVLKFFDDFFLRQVVIGPLGQQAAAV